MPSFAHFGNQLYNGERSFPFIARRRTWYTVAVVAVLLSLGALLVRGLNPSIEFRGGSEFRLSQVKDTSEILGQRAVSAAVPGTESRVSKLNSNSVRVQTDKLTKDQTDRVKTALAKAYGVDEATNVTSSFVGPSWGRDVSNKALTGLVVFLILVALVMALYFRTWKMAAAGMIALVHDLILTVGVYALVGFEVSPASVIGFLTILGYSLYDTVVVFDKVRENTEHLQASTRRTFAEAANLAVNQTLVRSINTSVVALLPVASILFIGAFLLGAGTLKDISLALFVGIAAGTYSSIFVATPLLVDLRQNEPELKQQAQRVLRRRAEDALKADQPGAAQLVEAGVGSGGLRDDAAQAGQRQQPKRGGRNRPGGRRR
jgi:preprotein translocase subunit SecF